jgi:hypothetical protein
MIINKAKINGLDLSLTYGGILENGTYNEIIKPFGAWPAQEKHLAIPVTMIGEGEVDFWQKWHALQAVLQSGADIIWEFPQLYSRYKLGYGSVSNFKMLSKVQGAGKLGASMVINLIDDYPETFTSIRSQVFTPANGLGTVTFTRTYTSYSQADADLLQAEDATFMTDGQNYANGYVAAYPPVPVSPTYFGPAAAIPTTAAQVKALSGIVGVGIMNFTVNTGLNRIIIIAIPSTKSLQTVWDVQAEEFLYRDGVTDNNYKLVRSLTIDGADYKIMALQNGLAYSSNHEQEVILKNG